ncbi:hypothetical protein SK128_021416, partial [Halocaridina rubra]
MLKGTGFLGFPVFVGLTIYCCLLLLCWFPSTIAQFKTEKLPFSDFLNYGKKKVKPGIELENEIIKSKVEVLGEILKNHVESLRR